MNLLYDINSNPYSFLVPTQMASYFLPSSLLAVGAPVVPTPRTLTFDSVGEAKNYLLFNYLRIGALHCTIAATSIALLYSLNSSFAFKLVRFLFRNPRPISSDKLFKSGVAYLKGKVTFDQSVAVIDPIFGVQLPKSNSNSCGIYRRVEALSRSLQWQEARYPWMNTINSTKTSPSSQSSSELFLNPSIRIDQYSIADAVLAPLMLPNTLDSRLPIQPKEIETHFQLLADKQMKAMTTFDSLALSHPIQNYKSHPFSQLHNLKSLDPEKQMHVHYDSNFIYLRQSPNKHSSGDLRISFYDFGSLAEVTLLGNLASKNGEHIDLIEDQEVKSFRAQKIKIERNGKIEYVSAEALSFIVKGLHEQSEMVMKVRNQIKSTGSYLTTSALALGIAALFWYIEYHTISEKTVDQYATFNKETNQVEVKYPSQVDYDPQHSSNSILHFIFLLSFKFGLVNWSLFQFSMLAFNHYRSLRNQIEKTDLINGQLNEIQLKINSTRNTNLLHK